MIKTFGSTMLAFIGVYVIGFLHVTRAKNGEEKLIKNLFSSDNIDVRPVENDTDPIEIMLGMALNQIIDVREKSEYITISVFLRQFWNASNLKWAPGDYNNVTSINVNSDKLWKPDIVLYNNVDEDKSFGGSLDQLHSRAIVKNTGEVNWFTPAILSAKCPMNVQYFPFDTQMCKLKFSSWTYNGLKLDINKVSDNIDLSAFQGHSEWHLDKAYIEKNVVTYGCCSEPYPDITMVLVMKRRSLFYLMNLIFPMVVISMLTMLSFCLPAESGERIALAITLLLAMTVFMLIVSEIIPPTSDTVPLVSSFFSSVMVEMVLMIIILCYILKLHFKSAEDEPMPQWMRKFILQNMSYILGIQKRPMNNAMYMNKTNNNNDNNNNKSTELIKELDSRIKSTSMIRSGVDTVVSADTDGNNISVTYVRSNGDVDKISESCFLSSSLQESGKDFYDDSNSSSPLLNRKVDSILQRFFDEDEANFIKREWRICALTLDRMSLIFFGVVFTITTLSCFMSAPGYTP